MYTTCLGSAEKPFSVATQVPGKSIHNLDCVTGEAPGAQRAEAHIYGTPSVQFRVALTTRTEAVRVPRPVIEEIYRASLRFAEVLDTLEVLLDKKTMHRIKLGEEQYRKRQYVVAKGRQAIRKVLSA